MILRRILEYLLHRAGTARGIYHSTLCYRQQAILTHTVVEILCYVAGKWRCRLVTIKPRRDTKTANIFSAGESLHHPIRRREPSLILIAGRGQQHLNSRLQLLISSTCHPRSQMGSLHCSRATATHHQEAKLGEAFAYAGNLDIVGIGTQHRVTSHHRHHTSLVITRQHSLQGVAHRVVVQGSCQHLADVGRNLTFTHIVTIYTRIITLTKRLLTLGVKARIERGSIV